jgi:xanthine dehydrogenase molybdopterin-binding subunit B
MLQVKCYGQTIGGILAESREIAKKAVKLVKVKYEILRPIITIQVQHNNSFELQRNTNIHIISKNNRITMQIHIHILPVQLLLHKVCSKRYRSINICY